MKKSLQKRKKNEKIKFIANNSQLDKTKANKYTKKTISTKMLKINEIVGKTTKNRH